jgi:hypothetical protein
VGRADGRVFRGLRVSEKRFAGVKEEVCGCQRRGLRVSKKRFARVKEEVSTGLEELK